MYYNINIEVKIGDDLKIENVQSFKINQFLTKLVNTASLEIPREFKEAKGKRLLDVINIGEKITISASYNDNPLVTEYEGYITNIGAEIPTVLECEDAMYKLKRTKKFNESFKNATLKDILNKVIEGFKIECIDQSFGKFIIENCTAFEVLEELKKYGVRCNFRNGVLHAGLLVDLNVKESHKYDFNKNIRASSDLKYVTKQSKEFKVKAISMQSGSSEKVTYEFGTATNGERTLHAPMNLSKSELKNWTENYYKNLVFDGYEGVVDGWFYPLTKVGDTLELTDPNYTDGHRDGKFLIEEMELSASRSDGLKRSNKISVKL